MIPFITAISAQKILNDRAGAGLKTDGFIGAKTIAAAERWIPWTFKGRPTSERWIAAIIQKEAGIRGFNAGATDAFWGPQTSDADERIRIARDGTKPFARPDDDLAGAISDDKSSIRCWSPTTAQFREKYGHEGDGMGRVVSPYALRLDWDLTTTLNGFAAHHTLTERIEGAMDEILATYGLEKIHELGLDRFGGCLNVRMKRGGSTPSVHSWGAAIDWFPSMNELKMTRKRAAFGKAAYDPFLDIWEKFGFMSLGRCFDFDWMHVQANP